MSDIVPAPIRGDTFRRTLFIVPQTGNLVGVLIKFTVKSKWSDATPLLQATTANGKIVVIDADTGEIEITFTAAEMAALAGDKIYVYDVEVTDGAGVVWSKVRESFRLVGDVS